MEISRDIKEDRVKKEEESYTEQQSRAEKARAQKEYAEANKEVKRNIKTDKTRRGYCTLPLFLSFIESHDNGVQTLKVDRKI